MKRSHAQIPSCTECELENSVLCALSEDQKEDISADKGNNFYKKGQIIFYEGNHSNGLFCIHKGKVKLTKLGEDGKEQVVRFAKTADLLGYRALLSNEPYYATAVAMEDCNICHLSKEKFISLLATNPSLSWNTIQVLSQDLKEAEQHLINIAQKTAKERIAEALILIYHSFGLMEDKQSLAVSLSRSEIADIAGTTTETTIRTLATLNKENLILLEGKTIKILKLKELTRTAGIYD